MLKISSSAVKEIKRIQQNRQKPDAFLKLAIISGGCSGFFYQLQLEDKSDRHSTDSNHAGNFTEIDRFEIDGIGVLVERRSRQYLDSLTIDYAEDLMGGGFRFSNNNSQIENVCGCGMSFSLGDT